MYVLIAANSLHVQVDPFLGINDDYQVYLKPQADVGAYCSAADNEAAVLSLSELRSKIHECHEIIKDTLVKSLSSIAEVLAVLKILCILLKNISTNLLSPVLKRKEIAKWIYLGPYLFSCGVP